MTTVNTLNVSLMSRLDPTSENRFRSKDLGGSAANYVMLTPASEANFELKVLPSRRSVVHLL